MYTVEDFKDDYDPDEDYMECEDESSFLYSLYRAFGGNADDQRTLGYIYSHSGYGVKEDCKKAEYFYLLASEAGDAKADFELGEMYFNKLKNHAGAVECFLRSAERGYNLAKARLGACYFNGYGVEIDYEKAKFWLLQSVEQDTYESPYLLACIYSHQGDTRSAIGFAQIASESNYPKAYGLLADLLYDKGEYEKAVEWLLLGAKRENADAQKQLASWYENGMGADFDLVEATIWYGRAARLGDEEAKSKYESLSETVDDPRLTVEKLKMRMRDGDTEAMILLGEAYIYGFYELPEDRRRGKNLLARAALKGSGEAAFDAGRLYFEDGDNNFGLIMLNKAVKAGFTEASLDLAGRYRDGEGVEKDERKALEYYLKAVDMCDPNNQRGKTLQGFAYTRIGDLYYYGKGVEKDYATAREYYLKATTRGISGAYYRLGNMFYYGLGGERDTAKAYRLYKEKAVENLDVFDVNLVENFDEVQYFYSSEEDYTDVKKYNAGNDLGLGNCRFFGEGTERDLKKATKNYLLALEHGFLEGGYNLALCYYYGAGVKKNAETAKTLLKRTAKAGYEKSKTLHKELFGEDL